MRVELLSTEGFDHGGDAGAFVTHGFSLKSNARSPKQNLAGWRRHRPTLIESPDDKNRCCWKVKRKLDPAGW
jgi:hypothetical protein